MASQTLDQQRAAHAWKAVTALKAAFDKKEKERAQFSTELKRLPVRIMNSGLAPALAYLAAKKKASELEKVLEDWINMRYPAQPKRPLPVRCLDDARTLRLYTAEALVYLQWFIRFAEATELLKKDDATGEVDG